MDGYGDLCSTTLGFTLDRLFIGGHRSPTPPNRFDPTWMLNPWHHTDLALCFGLVQLHIQITSFVYIQHLCIVAMFSSLGCRDWKMVDDVYCMRGFFLGPEIYWMGQSTGIQNPWHWILNLIPGSSLLNHHGRWMLMVSICWIVIVVKGMKRFLKHSIGQHR